MAWVDVLAVTVPRPDIWRGAGSSHCLSYRQMQRDERPSLHTISRPMKMLRDSLYSIGFEGLDTWFMLAPQATENLSISRYRANAALIGGNSEIYDDGIGLSAGQLLNPLVLALDRARGRLAVIESRGILQILDATERQTRKRRGITRWGTFGQGPGQFFVTPTTAVGVAIDSQGRIHVADAATAGGRIQTFTP